MFHKVVIVVASLMLNFTCFFSSGGTKNSKKSLVTPSIYDDPAPLTSQSQPLIAQASDAELFENILDEVDLSDDASIEKSGSDEDEFLILSSGPNTSWPPPKKAFSWYQKVADIEIKDEELEYIKNNNTPPDKERINRKVMFLSHHLALAIQGKLSHLSANIQLRLAGLHLIIIILIMIRLTQELRPFVQSEVVEEADSRGTTVLPEIDTNNIVSVTTAGNVKRYYDNWTHVTTNTFILRIVSEGYSIQFLRKLLS